MQLSYSRLATRTQTVDFRDDDAPAVLRQKSISQHQFPRSKSVTTFARAKVGCVCCVVSFPKFHYNDLLQTCWPCR